MIVFTEAEVESFQRRRGLLEKVVFALGGYCGLEDDEIADARHAEREVEFVRRFSLAG